ncbi:MAG: hypothetical protein AB7T22_09740 [Calditrichaceae bacterium]
MEKSVLWKVFFLLFLSLSPCLSQDINFDEQAFFENLKTSYYTLEQSKLNNVVSLVTSTKIERFAENNWQNAEIFPLQMIWVKPNSIYLSEQGVPPLRDENQISYHQSVDALKEQFKTILLDLQRFYINGIYASIGNDYTLIQDENTVRVSFSMNQVGGLIDYEYTFGINGLCLKIETYYHYDNNKVTTYPKFRIVKTKWICEGWEVQVSNQDQIRNGHLVLLKNRVVQDIFVPIEISIEAQKNTGEKFTEIIKIKNYLFNQPLRLLNDVKGDR